jgi:hypothetical protein
MYGYIWQFIKIIYGFGVIIRLWFWGVGVGMVWLEVWLSGECWLRELNLWEVMGRYFKFVLIGDYN